VLEDASHSGVIEETYGTVVVNLYLQLSSIEQDASSDVFKKTRSLPSLSFSFSFPSPKSSILHVILDSDVV
jgi:hypothetical protein